MGVTHERKYLFLSMNITGGREFCQRELLDGCMVYSRENVWKKRNDNQIVEENGHYSIMYSLWSTDAAEGQNQFQMIYCYPMKHIPPPHLLGVEITKWQLHRH